MTEVKLITECLKVRKALEAAAKRNMLPDQMFYRFPRGACLISSLVLAQYLQRFDSKNSFLIVSGWNRNTSHAWLEYDGYIIDVTADQFSESKEAVYFTKDRNFHSQFRYDRQVIKFSEYILGYDERVLYRFVCEHIDQKIENAK